MIFHVLPRLILMLVRINIYIDLELLYRFLLITIINIELTLH